MRASSSSSALLTIRRGVIISLAAAPPPAVVGISMNVERPSIASMVRDARTGRPARPELGDKQPPGACDRRDALPSIDLVVVMMLMMLMMLYADDVITMAMMLMMTMLAVASDARGARRDERLRRGSGPTSKGVDRRTERERERETLKNIRRRAIA